MAGIEFKGLDQLKADFTRLSDEISRSIMIEAEDAAAKVFETAIHGAVPRKTGQLASSVVTVDKMSAKQLTGQARKGRRSLYVGMEKKKGYYGYFVDQGFKAMGRAGRRRRTATGTTHSQMGVTGGRQVPGTNWFSNAVKNATGAAQAAYEAAFNNGIKKLG